MKLVQKLTSDITIYFNFEFFHSTFEITFSNPLNENDKKMDKNNSIKEMNKKIIKKL